MDLDVKYQGRVATSQDVKFINELIAENPDDSRRALSKKLCQAWNWVQPNGALRDMVCRGFLLCLESAGYIKLPPRRFTPNNPLPIAKGRRKWILIKGLYVLIYQIFNRLKYDRFGVPHLKSYLIA